jgi:hypothetical protein
MQLRRMAMLFYAGADGSFYFAGGEVGGATCEGMVAFK